MVTSSEIHMVRVENSNNKAIVLCDPEGNQTLWSYDSKIMTRLKGGKFIRHYSKYAYYGSTTAKHVKAFSGLTKKEFLELPEE